MKIEINSSCDCFCFDVFDTIISRTVSPEYVKKLWAKEIQAVYLPQKGVDEIYACRSRMERRLCERTQQKTGSLEFRLMDLYEEMYEEYKPLSADKQQFLKDALQYEINIEKSVQFVQEDAAELLQRLKKRKKTVLCISDFYAPQDFFEEIFQYHKINSFIDAFYISSEYLCTKRSGGLYDAVLADVPFDAHRMVMIGDNPHSDYEMPKSKGMQACLLDRKAQQAFYQAFEKNAGAKNKERALFRIYKQLNRDDYEDLAFALYHFIQKLYDRLRQEHIRHVFFLSREGEFLIRLFENYQDQRVHAKKDKIRAHYLMASRKSTLMPSLKTLDEEAFAMIFRQYIHISLFDFLSSLGFDLKEQTQIGRQLGADIYEKQEDLPRRAVFENLKGNSLFQALYEKKRTEQNRNFRSYLDSFGVDFTKEPFTLVDVGWKGTIQDNIYNYFGGRVKVKGFYLGLAAAGNIQEDNEKCGLLFSCLGQKSKYFAVYNENKSIFEVILGASHGSADRYECRNGTAIVLTSEKQEEHDLFTAVIHPMQAKIEAVFHSIDKELISCACKAEQFADFFACVHANLVYKPTRKQMEFFYQIYHFENFGIFEFSRFKSRDRVTLSDRIRGVKGILDRSLFLNSFWGVNALKNAGLSALIRPYGIYMYRRHYLKERDSL